MIKLKPWAGWLCKVLLLITVARRSQYQHCIVLSLILADIDTN